VDPDLHSVSVKTMRARMLVLAVFGFLLGSAGPVTAQVEKAAVRTTGISCGVCAAMSEMRFRRLPGIKNVAITLSSETITLFYKSEAAFDPRQIRRVLQPLGIGVVQFRISASGRVGQDGAKRVFAVGKDKFELTPECAAAVPRDIPIFIEGVIDDAFDPVRLKVLSFRQLKE